MKKFVSFFPLLLIAFVLMGAVGCSPGPEPEELLELERMLQDPKALEIRDAPGAGRFFQESRQFRRLSREAHSERKETLAREYAILGTLRYRTAIAVAGQSEAKGRLDAANARVEQVNPEIRAANAERNKLAQEIGDLEAQIATAVRLRSEREGEVAESSFVPAQQNPGVNRPSVGDVNARIREAEAAREQASGVEASKYARVAFDRGELQLRTARELVNTQPDATDVSMQQANSALTLFREAHATAEPQFRAWQEKMKPENRIAAIRQDAVNNFGAPFTSTEHGGIRIVMARLFEPQSADFRFNTDAWLDSLAKLIQDYDEFSVTIEGYTQRRGNATENLATSQLRAHRVRDYLVSKGVSADRITTEGFGQDRLRFSDSAENNDRVELILRHSR